MDYIFRWLLLVSWLLFGMSSQSLEHARLALCLRDIPKNLTQVEV
jgi:hypothetical protein